MKPSVTAIVFFACVSALAQTAVVQSVFRHEIHIVLPSDTNNMATQLIWDVYYKDNLKQAARIATDYDGDGALEQLRQKLYCEGDVIYEHWSKGNMVYMEIIESVIEPSYPCAFDSEVKSDDECTVQRFLRIDTDHDDLVDSIGFTILQGTNTYELGFAVSNSVVYPTNLSAYVTTVVTSRFTYLPGAIMTYGWDD